MSTSAEENVTASGSKPDDEYFPDDHYREQLQGVKRWKPRALPSALNIDGKHVWEPPILAYNDLIGENYEKKREAVLKFTKGDRARATEFLDADVMYDLLEIYQNWLIDNVYNTKDSDPERASFFAQLEEEVGKEITEVHNEYHSLDISQKKNKDGTWTIWKSFDPAFTTIVSDSDGIQVLRDGLDPDPAREEEGASQTVPEPDAQTDGKEHENEDEPAFPQVVSEPDTQTDGDERGEGHDTPQSEAESSISETTRLLQVTNCGAGEEGQDELQPEAQPPISETTPLLRTTPNAEQPRHKVGRTTCGCAIQ